MSQIRSLAAIATAAVLATAAAPARSQEIPNLSLDPVCRGIAQQASTVAEKGAADLAFSQCVQSEQAMRQKLAGEWSTFSPSEKNQLHRRANGGHGELHRPYHLP
jgi:hypothetical protein